MKLSESLSAREAAEPVGLDPNVKALGWVSFFTDVQSESILPILPLFLIQVLGLSQTFLGLIEGVADSASSLFKIFSGWYSDRIRQRKQPTFAGYLLSAIVKPLIAFTSTGPAVLAVRFTDRMGKGIRTAPRDALIADSTPPHLLGQSFGFHRMMDTLGAVAGTAFCYLMLHALRGSDGRKMRTIFLASAVFGAVALVILTLFVREKRRQPASLSVVNMPVKPRLVSKTLGYFLGINVLFYLGMFSYAFFLLRAQNLGVATGQVPLIYLLYNIIYAAVSMPMGRISDRIGRKKIILLAYALYGILCFGIAVATHVWQVWALFALYGIHSATVNPASRALVAELSQMETRGTALGLFHASVGCAALPASVGAGLLWDAFGPATPFFVAGSLSLLAFLLLLPLTLGLGKY